MLERVWRKQNPSTLSVGMQIGASTMENTVEVPQKPKNRITIWSINRTPGHISGQKFNSKRYTHSCVQNSTIHNSQDMEKTLMSMDWWMDKEDVVHIYSGILLSHKKNEIMPFAVTWMDLEIIILSEGRSNRERQIIIWCHSYVESIFLNDTNELIYKIETAL